MRKFLQLATDFLGKEAVFSIEKKSISIVFEDEIEVKLLIGAMYGFLKAIKGIFELLKG